MEDRVNPYWEKSFNGLRFYVIPTTQEDGLEYGYIDKARPLEAYDTTHVYPIIRYRRYLFVRGRNFSSLQERLWRRSLEKTLRTMAVRITSTEVGPLDDVSELFTLTP